MLNETLLLLRRLRSVPPSLEAGICILRGCLLRVELRRENAPDRGMRPKALERYEKVSNLLENHNHPKISSAR
jgi:hypothetical protein